ncbi:AAWKG family protein [Streptomyces sp. NPDC001770]
MPANYDTDDYWGKAVTLFTGYGVPSRKGLFEKLSSKEGIPLFRMDIQDTGMRAVTANDFSALSGWMTHSGEDYDLTFYNAGGDGSHSGVSMRRARIVFIGVPTDANGQARLLEQGETMAGGEFTGHYGDEWDFGPLGQYVSGSKGALDELLDTRSSRGFSYSGLAVLNNEAVDLDSFERTGRAFDRALGFFNEHATALAQWETSLGGDQSAWRGKAAGLFWHLVHQLHKNYDSYVEQMGGATYTGTHTSPTGYVPKSRLSDALISAQKTLIDEATNLRNAWTTWANTREHDPHRSVLEILDQVSAWVLENNIPHIQQHTSGGYYSTTVTYSSTAAFKQNHPVYGDLNDTANWKKIGEAAVKRWNDYIEAQLIPVATTALTNVNNAWIDVQDAFDEPLKTKDTSTLSEEYQKDEADLAREEAENNSNTLNDTLNNLGNGLGDNFDNLNDNLNKNLNDINDGLNENLNDVTSGLNDSLNGLGDGLGDGLSKGLNDINDGLGESVDNLNSGLDGINDGLNEAVSGLDDGLGGLGGDPGTGGLGTDTTTDLNGLTGPNLEGLTGGLNLPGLTSPSKNDGKTSDLNGGLGLDALTNPDGSTTQLNADGSLTTTYPDGTVQKVDPAAGTVTTTSPDGTVTTSDLNTGVGFTNPDGSVTTLNPDGTLTTTRPDGTVQNLDPDTGAVSTTAPDGTVTQSTLHPHTGAFTTADGNTAQLNPDGSLATTYPDGTVQKIDPATGTVTTTAPDGTVTTSHLNSGVGFTNPDGSVTTLNPDGTLTTTYPDGTKEILDPGTGALTTTAPNGTSTTTDLNGSSPGGGLDLDFPDIPTTGSSSLNGSSGPGTAGSSFDSLTSLNHDGLSSGGLSSGGLSSGGLSPGGSGSLLDDSAAYEDYDSTPYTGGALGAPGGSSGVLAAAAEGSSGSSGSPSGVPLNPSGMGGGMGGGGMGGMGGGGGGGSSERVRNVLSETGGAVSRRASGSRARGAVADEDEEIRVTRGGTATSSSPFYPGGGGGGAQAGQSTESGDRARNSWVAEDEDVWGTDEGGSPAVIGR